ncbi:MAG: HAMP domain-containing histidine kinase [Proteobacteria bacterium]|nr:MAG: HAMP domain-containing histidine kinase [Pseudomonadota bacterium]
MIRTQLELAPTNEGSELLLEDVDRMARQIQQLLILAEVSEPQNYRMEPVNPRATVIEVFNFMERVAEQHKVLLGLRIEDDVGRWSFDRGALFTLLKNLLENAIQHSPAGTLVALHVGSTGMSVKDHGSGIPTDLLPRIFERFWRGPERREKGAGLGLAICQEIASAHGWTLEAISAGTGLEMRVTWPFKLGPRF